MWEEILSLAVNNGLLPALFVALLIYVLRDTSRREKQYQIIEEENRSIIARLAEGFRIVSEIKIVTDEINKKMTDADGKKSS